MRGAACVPPAAAAACSLGVKTKGGDRVGSIAEASERTAHNGNVSPWAGQVRARALQLWRELLAKQLLNTAQIGEIVVHALQALRSLHAPRTCGLAWPGLAVPSAVCAGLSGTGPRLSGTAPKWDRA